MADKKTILIIDDEVNLAELVRHQLESKGYCVVTASDGRQGLDKLESIIPDLIILDVNMPNMTGIEFYKAIMTEHGRAKFPVLVLTTRSNLQETFRDVEAAGFMPKPFIMDKLVGEVDRITSGDPKEAVFIIDFDKDLHIDYIEEVLFKENYEVYNIASFEKLAEKTARKIPSFIITKDRQGQMECGKLIGQIKEHEHLSNVPVIVYSFSGDPQEEEILQSGADKFLNKPENYQEFMKAIREIELSKKA